MDRIKHKKLIGMSLLFTVLILFGSICIFLPGSNSLFGTFQIIYNISMLGSTVLLLYLLTISIVMLFCFLKKLNEQGARAEYSWSAVIFFLIFLFAFFWEREVTHWMRGLARDIAIQNAEILPTAIQKYHMANRAYPETLKLLVPEYIDSIPVSGIIGIKNYTYKKINENNFEISFTQNLILYFNFEIVTYNHMGLHKPSGEKPVLYGASKPNWKYCIVD